MGIPDQDAVTSYKPLLYYHLSWNEALLPWRKIWINWQYDTEREPEENFREIYVWNLINESLIQ